MPKFSRDTIALRRAVFGALWAFVIGVVLTLATFAWLIVRFLVPEAPWWRVVITSIMAILISIIYGGLGFAALVSCLLDWYHYRRGFYRCRFCHKPYKKPGFLCDCAEAQKAGIILYEDAA